jgi:hypothetical protein
MLLLQLALSQPTITAVILNKLLLLLHDTVPALQQATLGLPRHC